MAGLRNSDSVVIRFIRPETPSADSVHAQQVPGVQVMVYYNILVHCIQVAEDAWASLRGKGTHRLAGDDNGTAKRGLRV